MTHRSVVDLALGGTFAGGGHDRVLVHSPTAFDASTYELWTPLLSGGSLVIAPAGRLGVTELAATIDRGAATAADVRPGRHPPARPRRSPRRAVHRGKRPRPRLRGPPRPHRRTLRRLPLRRARKPDVPHGRPGPLDHHG
ncbi:hypothetical protein [Kitasatospora aureofaciens]|uniref:hypothetical protein n=1 Tax=Kitasatospora aureofaciens TaxID=1894 RepID=UPI003CC7E6A7